MCLSEDIPKVASVKVSSANEKLMKRTLQNGKPETVGNDSASSQAYLDSFSGFSFIVAGFVVSCATFVFSVYFPFMLAPSAASKTYFLALWNYDESLHHFDNTIWTYGTDYGLALVMAIIAVSILRCDECQSSQFMSSKLRWRSAGLLLLYSASTLAGAIAHQYIWTFESHNDFLFRFVWTICVGTVCFASALMGCVGTELARQYRNMGPVPVIDEKFWVSFGTTTLLICIMGGFSYQRPACDIFIAGTTQIPSTAYVMFILAVQCGHPSLLCSIRWRYRVMGCLGFILNAPLLPMYPLLVQYTDLSLAAINTLLHTCLLGAWGMQGLSMRHLAVALARSKQKPYHAVPVPQNKKLF